ncbi:hypothetical protein CJF32_00008018 [Rutstroemia sp. NJR-2017a WRK4]|nr:hypothetical protein CJF32_00008018 [Rutstroemia sp. NJR-2017a WRK4]
MHFLTLIFSSAMLILPLSNACYFTVHSTTVGDFKAQHSEPKDHAGAPQTITGSSSTCSFSGNLADGCIITLKTNVGCGNLSFTRIGSD